MKLLITGSNGLTGQAILRVANHHKEIEIIATSKQPNRSPYPVKFELLDITRKEKLNYLLDLYQPDAVIHTAAISQIDECEKDKISCHQINYEAVENLAEACASRQIFLVHMSSDFVFEGNSQIPYKTYDKRNPVNYYGECKLKAEDALIESACKHAIVRTALVFDYPQNINRNNIFRWIYHSLSDKKHIKLVDDQFRTPTFVDDLAESLIQIASLKKDGIWHVCGEEQISVYHFGLRIAEHFHLDRNLISPVSSSSLQQAARRPAKTYLDIRETLAEIQHIPNNISQAFSVIESRIRTN